MFWCFYLPLYRDFFIMNIFTMIHRSFVFDKSRTTSNKRLCSLHACCIIMKPIGKENNIRIKISKLILVHKLPVVHKLLSASLPLFLL